MTNKRYGRKFNIGYGKYKQWIYDAKSNSKIGFAKYDSNGNMTDHYINRNQKKW